jgi:hypothetical protein
MILKRFILFFLFIIATACNRFGGPDKPENLISKEKMVSILIDSKLLTTGNSMTKRIMKDSSVDMSTYIFKKHNIDSLQFALSNSYYAFHIEDYEEIFTMAIDSLERLGVKLKDVQAEEWKEQTKREEDSLNLITSKKDSLKLLNPQDSLDIIDNVDSLSEVQLDFKYKKKNSLITPISDTLDLQI